MKNILSIFGWKPKSPKPKPGKPEIRLPFSSGNDKRQQDRPASHADSGKTQVGIQVNRPSSDSPKARKGNSILSCPECKYPLRVEPSRSSPCPNCGFLGDRNDQTDTAINLGKTIPISGLDSLIEPGVEEFKFKLIDESTKSEIKVQSEDRELILNRDHLDPTNTSISSEQHLLVIFRNNKIFMEDVSTNGSSFIQVTGFMMLKPRIRIILGNKTYLFDSVENPERNTAKDRASRKFEGNELSSKEPKNLVLIDEKSGEKKTFHEQHVMVNRTNLDTSNNTISGSRHAEFTFQNGNWYIKDLSSTGATFLQITTQQQLDNNIKLIIGNKVFRFEYDV